MPRVLAISVFVCLALGILVGGHVYLALRLVVEPLDGAAETVGLGVITLLALSLVAQPIAERTLRPPASRWIAWPASLWMGAAFWLLLVLPLLDLLLVDTPLAGLRAPLALGVVSVALIAGLRSGLAPPRLVREGFEIERWPAALDGFRIVQISDLHIGPILGRDFAASLAQRINARQPDLVAVTGDLVDGDADCLAAEVAPLADLRAAYGVYFVTGNHDHYSGASAWVARVQELGMRPLRNQRVSIGPQGASFDLVGVDDHHAHYTGGGREDLDAALEGRDPSRPALLLAHDPNTFAQARLAPVDLQLSGHTHGGQIWPFAWFVRLATRWVAGRYREGRAQLYVSRGTGFWGPPMRLGSPAEITEITLSAPRQPS